MEILNISKKTMFKIKTKLGMPIKEWDIPETKKKKPKQEKPPQKAESKIEKLKEFHKSNKTYEKEYVVPHKRRGTIYFDTSCKRVSFGRPVSHNLWCAEIVIKGKRYRKRNKDYEKCVSFLERMTAEYYGD